MQEYIELEAKGGKFYSKCRSVLKTARDSSNKLQRKVISVRNSMVENQSFNYSNQKKDPKSNTDFFKFHRNKKLIDFE